MPQINWDMLNGYANVGQAVSQGFQVGQQQAKQARLGNALKAYATNPDDPGAVAGVIAVDPVLGMRVQDDARQRAEVARTRKEAQEKTARQQILDGAKIVREVNPVDQPSWERARAAATAMGIPLDNVPTTFDPNYVQQLIQTADAYDPRKSTEETGFMREAAAAGIKPGTPEYRRLLEQRYNPARFITDANGNIRVIDPSAFSGASGQPATSPPAVLTDDDWGDVGGAPQSGAPTFP